MKATFQAIALTSTNQRKATLKAKKAHESLLDRSFDCWSVLQTTVALQKPYIVNIKQKCFHLLCFF